ncbi:MAG TPA: LysM peptidoglycan-binding domain-containing protein [Rhodanobacteraceae bacterium]|nr:LysM peptidoglycan-binding domain-containing protein [Rhodanobacteraceae bacterium]
MIRRLRLPTSALALLLAACSTPAPRPAPPPPIPAPAPAPVTQPPMPEPQPAVTTTPAVEPDTWQRLRAGFAMDDCIAPALRRAHRETRNRQRFEQRMQQLLPLIDYVQRAAGQQHVAGEFALLPWVESHFHQTPPRRHRPAGMWQIMPITGRAMHLDMNRHYDGRLDPIASTHAVMKLLSGYHDKWHDWRMADMAYNTGEYRLRRILKSHGMPPAKPVIPTLPVGRTTRQHLTRLLAIACIIRDPQRFQVNLPKLDPDRRLEAVSLPAPVSLQQVAQAADMSEKRLQQLNAGYRLGGVTTGTPMQLLLPTTAAQTLRTAIASGRLHDETRRLAARAAAASSYTVVSGDSLWSIAQRFDVDVEQLRQWNHLDDSVLHPGQTLQLSPPSSG